MHYFRSFAKDVSIEVAGLRQLLSHRLLPSIQTGVDQEP